MVSGGYLVVAAAELLGHWLLNLDLFRSLLWIYSLHTTSGGVAMFLDLILPAFLLGWWNAWVSRNSSSKRAAHFILPLAFGTVALIPLYAVLVRAKEATWWWPKTDVEIALNLAVNLFFATIPVLLPIKAYHKNFPI